MSFGTFSTHAPNFLAEPFSQYRMLQSAPDVFWSEKERAWIVHRYRDVAALLADRNFAVVELASVVGELSALRERSVADLVSVLSVVLFLRNPPGHTERRHFLAALINDRPKSAQMALIDQIGKELIAGFGEAQDIDIVKRFADVLPPLFIGRLLGLPDAMVLALMAVMTEVTKSFDNGRSLRFYQRVNETVIKARAMIDPEIADRRDAPRDDGLSRMISLWDERFNVDDLALGSHVLFLLIAGAETTSALIGNAVAAALDRPEGLALICDDSNLIAPWIEETLRFDGPAHQSSRIALQNCQVAGAPIAKGDRLILLIAAAHRDPEQFAAADEFDPLRTDQSLLAFGAGLHFCPGAQIARMEALSSLQLLAPRLQPAPNSQTKRQYWEHRTLRRLESLHVRLLPSHQKD